MTFALTAALILALAGFLVLTDRKDARQATERDREREERQILLQRIQAPDAAIVDHSMRDLPVDPSGFPMSDAEVAEQQERERVIKFIEQHENGAG